MLPNNFLQFSDFHCSFLKSNKNNGYHCPFNIQYNKNQNFVTWNFPEGSFKFLLWITDQKQNYQNIFFIVLSFMILGNTCKNENFWNIHPCRLYESRRISPLTNLFQGFPVFLCNCCRILKSIKINGNVGMTLYNIQ